MYLYRLIWFIYDNSLVSLVSIRLKLKYILILKIKSLPHWRCQIFSLLPDFIGAELNVRCFVVGVAPGHGSHAARPATARAGGHPVSGGWGGRWAGGGVGRGIGGAGGDAADAPWGGGAADQWDATPDQNAGEVSDGTSRRLVF